MPNITGSVDGVAGNTGKGAFTHNASEYKAEIGNADYLNSTYNVLYFNASNSNAIFGNAQTVQPPAINLIPQIKY